MTTFPVGPARLDGLRATRAGRVALAGFEYQRAFAILRLTALVTRRAVRGAVEIPTWLRYEWAEDLDEVTADGASILWQCKHGAGWGQPAKLVDVLLGFAPKWLWSPEAARPNLRFRLVTSDPAFARFLDLPGAPPGETDVCRAFLAKLATDPDPRADQARWQTDANAVGHGALFDALWAATQVLYVPGTAATAGNVGIWDAERAAVEVLGLAGKVADIRRSDEIVPALRALLGADAGRADADGTVARLDAAPRPVLAVQVEHRLVPFAPAAANVRLDVVDATALRQLLADPVRGPYVARRPEWPDVVRGGSAEIRFFERTATEEVTQAVREALQAARTRQGKLRVQFLVGAPGSGKSTLALRVAAKLVLDGACVAVDARHELDPDEDVDDRVAELQRLASPDLPLLLLLDDPLGGDSGWPRLLTRLSRGAPPIVVLAATPDFLLDRHRHELRGVQELHGIAVERPDRDECRALAALYPEARGRIEDADEELLVLAMQAAADAPFDDIVRGIWGTLADRRLAVGNVLGRALPWEQVAYTAVTFFHRAYAPCPRPLLEALLEERPDVGTDAVERLGQVEQAQGWRIFQVEAPADRWTYMGGTVRTMHARVAQQSWELRPAPAWDLGPALARASIEAPHAARPLARGLVALQERGAAEAQRTLEAVAAAWAGATAVETRNLCELAAVLTVGGVQRPEALRGELRRRAHLADAQSWLAALQLYYLSGRQPSGRSIPADLPMLEIVDAGDFSVAPNRSSKLVNVLAARPAERTRLLCRLWRAFDGDLPWTVDSFLLTMILAQGDRADVRARLDRLRDWLRDHPDDAHVRGAFLAHLGRFPGDAVPTDAPDALAWVRMHPADTTARVALLKLLAARNAPELCDALADTLDVTEQGTRFFSSAGAALVAAATLPSAHASLLARWLAWATAVLNAHVGERSAHVIASAIPAGARRLRDHLRHALPPAVHTEAHATLDAAAVAWRRWYASVRENPPFPFP